MEVMVEGVHRVVWQEVREQWLLDSRGGYGGGGGGEAAKCGMARSWGTMVI